MGPTKSGRPTAAKRGTVKRVVPVEDPPVEIKKGKKGTAQPSTTASSLDLNGMSVEEVFAMRKTRTRPTAQELMNEHYVLLREEQKERDESFKKEFADQLKKFTEQNVSSNRNLETIFQRGITCIAQAIGDLVNKLENVGESHDERGGQEADENCTEEQVKEEERENQEDGVDERHEDKQREDLEKSGSAKRNVERPDEVGYQHYFPDLIGECGDRPPFDVTKTGTQVYSMDDTERTCVDRRRFDGIKSEVGEDLVVNELAGNNDRSVCSVKAGMIEGMTEVCQFAVERVENELGRKILCSPTSRTVRKILQRHLRRLLMSEFPSTPATSMQHVVSSGSLEGHVKCNGLIVQWFGRLDDYEQLPGVSREGIIALVCQNLLLVESKKKLRPE